MVKKVAAYTHDFFTRFLHEGHLPVVWIHIRHGRDKALVRSMNLIRKHIHQHLRVRGRAKHAVEERLGGLQHIPQLCGVGQVAIVDQVDAERRVDEERLCLLATGRTSCGIAYMSKTGTTCTHSCRVTIMQPPVGSETCMAVHVREL